MNLYELTGEMLGLLAMAEEEDLDPEVLADTMEGLEWEYEDKLEAYCKVIRNIEADIAGIKAEVERMTALKKTMEANISRIKDVMFSSMRATGKEKITGKLFKLSITKNGGQLPLHLDEDADIPLEFQKVTISADTNKIRKALDAGQVLEFAKYGERGETLRIK